jgi:hypothetical protein
MISDVIISRLDELVGDFDTPFFNYLIYSYDLPINDCELIIAELKSDIRENRIIPDNVVATLQDYFKSRVTDIEKEDKISYLSRLISKDSDFYSKFLGKYGLSDDEIEIVFNRIKSRILEDNISEFEIKRYLMYYFENTVKQVKYNKDLDMIRGRSFDTLIIRNVKRKYPILLNGDIVDIYNYIREEIIDAKEFKKGIKHEFERQCLLKSEAKKADARKRLTILVEGKGDSFNKLISVKRLTRRDGDLIVSQIIEDINLGKIQPEKVNGNLLTNRFNEYIKNER